MSGGVSSSGTFKDFEKKTFDAWEIDDDLSNTSGGSIMNTYSLSGFSNNEYAMPISLLVRFIKKNIYRKPFVDTFLLSRHT
jgi:hypothetical protein